MRSKAEKELLGKAKAILDVEGRIFQKKVEMQALERKLKELQEDYLKHA